MKIPERECLRCHVPVNAETCINNSSAPQPKEGDLTICIYCGHAMAFAEGMALRELTPEEQAWCDHNELVQRMLKVRAETAPTHPHRKVLQ